MKRIYLKLALTFFCLFLLTKLAYAQKSNVKLPENYTFTWKMSMTMKIDKNDMVLDYYLKENEDYLGFSSEEITKQAQGAKVFVVMDAKRDVSCTFMDVMGQKMLQKSKFQASNADNINDDNIQVKEIGTKTILGYNCQGFETTTDEYKMVFYVTNDVPVNFTNVFKSSGMALPNGFNNSALQQYASKGAMLEMQITNLKTKEVATMTCTAIEKNNLTIKTSDYKSMF